MARPRFSVVIPVREGATTLPFTIRTCLDQSRDDLEIVISDNCSTPATRLALEAFDDARIRYFRTQKLLSMSDSWEFALGKATGEYILLIGCDDGLLLHALGEIDRLIRLLNARVLQWDSALYTWPNLPEQRHTRANELLLPLKLNSESYFPIERVAASQVITAVANGEKEYTALPLIYNRAVVHRSVLDEIRSVAGRVFCGRIPDVFSGFAIASTAGEYFSVSAPMGISGLSGGSNGVATHYLDGNSPVAEEFDRLNDQDGHVRHPWVPDLPFMASAVADSFLRARELFSWPPDWSAFDRKKLIGRCLDEIGASRPEVWPRVLRSMRNALVDDPALLDWFDRAHGDSPFGEGGPPRNRTAEKRYGGSYVRLDTAEFGVGDIAAAAGLVERVLGLRRDGVNAHLRPAPVPATPPMEVAAPATGLYHQELEVELLTRILSQLDDKTVIDVGAERGGFVDAFLEAGCATIHAFEPYPAHAALLELRYRGRENVRLFRFAVGENDEVRPLHIASRADGRDHDFYHSLVAFEDSEEIRWGRDITVECRSLDSLVKNGELPDRIGILKVDTEGNDLEVLRGAGSLHCSVIMVEFWKDLPRIFGRDAYSVGDVVDLLRPRGYSNYVCIKRHEEFQHAQIDNPSIRSGDWGNVVFIHKSVYPALAPLIHELAARAQTRLVDQSLTFRSECHARAAVITQLEQVAGERLTVIEVLKRAADDRLAVIDDLKRVADERGAALTRMDEFLNGRT